jgi:uncharacterized membrane protein
MKRNAVRTWMIGIQVLIMWTSALYAAIGVATHSYAVTVVYVLMIILLAILGASGVVVNFIMNSFSPRGRAFFTFTVKILLFLFYLVRVFYWMEAIADVEAYSLIMVLNSMAIYSAVALLVASVSLDILSLKRDREYDSGYNRRSVTVATE